MNYFERLKRLVTDHKVAIYDMYWLAGVTIEHLPEGLRSIIEGRDPRALEDIFGLDVSGYLHPEQYSAEDFLGVAFQKNFRLDGFVARVSIPVRFYNAKGEHIQSTGDGYMVDIYAQTVEELIPLIETAIREYARMDLENSGKVQAGIPLFVDISDEPIDTVDEKPFH